MKGEWKRKPIGKTTVIFVHGILSNGDSCWLNKNGSYWPTLLCDEPDLKKFGVYIFTYPTGIFSGSYNLNDIVVALRHHIDFEKLTDHKRIIFVCHSMGGIVVRKYLVDQVVDLIKSETEIGLFLVASPSLGAKYANMLKPLADILGNSQADALRFGQNNYWLNGLDSQFKDLKESGKLKLFGKELVEDKFVILRRIFKKQVVEPFSGTVNFEKSIKIPNSDHYSIAKPSDKDAFQHKLLCEFLEENDSFPFSKPDTNIRIKNKWNNTYIIFENGAVLAENIKNDYTNAKWILEDVKHDENGIEYYRLKNRIDKKCINIEKGFVNCTEVKEGWHSSHWLLESVPDTNLYWIKNRWKNTFLNIEHGSLECSVIDPNWWSARWFIEKAK